MDEQAICVECRECFADKEWTCPHCGAIADRYLFGTITLNSLSGDARNAYRSGYQDCIEQQSRTSNTAVQRESYKPIKGNETAYRAGWQQAANKLNAKADRKFGRRRGVHVMGGGLVAVAVGAVIALLTYKTLGVQVIFVAPIGLGLLSVVIGLVMIITGTTDEARPDA